MSAYVVTDETIHALVTTLTLGSGTVVYHGGTTYRYGGEEADTVGQTLVDANYASVNHRYSEAEHPHTYRHVLRAAGESPVTILKLCSHYEYQACEHPGYEGSLAASFIRTIREETIPKLPGYDAAPWGLPERAEVTW